MLTTVQTDKLTHFFTILDHNRNGVLQKDDFVGIAENLCAASGIREGSKEYNNVLLRSEILFQQFLRDLNKNDARITLDEWIDYFDRFVISRSDFTHLKFYIKLTAKYIFDLFDQNEDGRISIDEYLDMFAVYRIDCKYSAKSFLRLDTNRDEYISKGELLKAVFEFFVSDDPEAHGNWIFGDWKVEHPIYNQ